MRYLVFTLSLMSIFFINIDDSNAQTLDRVFKKWSVYTTKLQGTKSCYLASFPASKSGNYARRDQPYLLVTRVNNSSYEVSTSSGYQYKLNSDVKIDIAGAKYNMFTKGDIAWTYNKSQDSKVIDLMRSKASMTVRGVSSKGTYSLDKYSLMGFTAAFNRMKKLCG